MINFTIVPLSLNPGFADACAAWSYGQWGCQSNQSLMEKIERYRNSASNGRGELPLTWVAISNDRPAGMISLKDKDHPDYTDLPLWLGSLFVHPEYRGQGMAHAMIETLEAETLKIYGAGTLHLFTANAAKLYETHGFRHVAKIRSFNGLHPDGNFLMKKDLN